MTHETTTRTLVGLLALPLSGGCMLAGERELFPSEGVTVPGPPGTLAVGGTLPLEVTGDPARVRIESDAPDVVAVERRDGAWRARGVAPGTATLYLVDDARGRVGWEAHLDVAAPDRVVLALGVRAGLERLRGLAGGAEALGVQLRAGDQPLLGDGAATATATGAVTLDAAVAPVEYSAAGWAALFGWTRPLGLRFDAPGAGAVTVRAGHASATLPVEVVERAGPLAIVWFPGPHAPHVGDAETIATFASGPPERIEDWGLAELRAVDESRGPLAGLRPRWAAGDGGALAVTPAVPSPDAVVQAVAAGRHRLGCALDGARYHADVVIDPAPHAR